MNVICNSCDTVMDEGDVLSYEEREMAASNLVYHKGWKCPFCGVCDDFDDVTWQFAVDELNGIIETPWPTGKPFGLFNTSRLKRLAAIKDLIEGEIE